MCINDIAFHCRKYSMKCLVLSTLLGGEKLVSSMDWFDTALIIGEFTKGSRY